MSFCGNNVCLHTSRGGSRGWTHLHGARLALAWSNKMLQAESMPNLGKEINEHMRMTVHYRVSLSTSSTKTGEERLLDLSAEGCRIECASRLPVNTYLSLRLVIFPDEPPILVDLAAVRWADETQCGVQFLSVQPQQAERLQDFLASPIPLDDPRSPEDR